MSIKTSNDLPMYRNTEITDIHDHSIYMLSCNNVKAIAGKITDILDDIYIVVKVEEYYNWEPKIATRQKLYKTNEHPNPVSFISKCPYSRITINDIWGNYSFSSDIESDQLDYKFQRQSLIEFGYREFMVKHRNSDNQVIIWKFKAV